MKHVNVDTRVLMEPEFTEATNAQVGVWFKLCTYCAQNENGGLILNAGGWSDTHCLRMLGCTRADLEASPLWHITPGGLLALYHYNVLAEEFAKRARKTQAVACRSKSPAKQAAARQNGKRGGRTRKTRSVSAYQKPTNSSNFTEPTVK